ncbi:MAG TPA: hypothetical protein VLW54_08085, partial [Candidatus Acidoferrales bacterium]|nr:hypothetical protein [Candidatus Acidoferrales bacterium]
PVATFTPTAATGVNFGAVVPGQTSAVMSVTLAVAAGTGNLQISFIQTISDSDTSDFAIVGGTTCPTDGGTVTAGTSCVVMMTYTPSFAGTETGSLQFAGTNLTGSPVNIPLTGIGASTAAGFTVTSPGGTGGTTVTILPGDTATFTLVLQPNPGFIGPITLMCASGIPATIATVNPAMVNVTTTPSGPITVTCTLQTNCVPALVGPREHRPEGPGPLAPGAELGGLLLLVAMLCRKGAGRASRGGGWAGRLVPVAAAVLLVLVVMSGAACVSNPPPAIPGAPTTPAGVYQIQLIATAPGNVHQTVSLTVHVI